MTAPPRTATILAVLVVAAFAGPVRAQTASKPAPQAVVQVKRLSDEEVQAFLHKDPKTMARLWSDDLVVTNPLNKLVTKKQVLDLVESGFLVITSYDRTVEYARAYPRTVILAGTETVVWGGRMPNAGKTEHLRFTAVWMQQRGRWQEVARHANIVPAP